MGKVQKKLGRLHEALASFNQALDLDPKSGNMIKAHIDRLQVVHNFSCRCSGLKVILDSGVAFPASDFESLEA